MCCADFLPLNVWDEITYRAVNINTFSQLCLSSPNKPPFSRLYFRLLNRMDPVWTHLTLSAQLAEKLLIVKLAFLVRDYPRHLHQIFLTPRDPLFCPLWGKKKTKTRWSRRVHVKPCASFRISLTSSLPCLSVCLFFFFFALSAAGSCD